MFFPPSRRSLTAVFGAAALLFWPACATAGQDSHASSHDRIEQVRVEQVLSSINRGHSLGQVAVSPDGRRVAWIQGARDGAEIRVALIGAIDKSERVTAAASADQHCREDQIAWSPDSKSLAFLSDCADRDGEADGQDDLYITRLDANRPRRVTELHGFVHDPAFSPDGESIAFLYVEGATRAAGALAAMKPPSGVIGEDNIEVQRVAVTRLDVAASNAMQVTPANLHVYEFDWSPDSKSLAYIAADPPGENNWWVAKLYTQELSGAPKAVLAPAEVAGPLRGLQIAAPRWSPDGKTIAFIGGLMSDEGVTGGDVWIVSAAGGQPHNLTSQRPTSPAWITWDGNDHIYVSELAGGNCQLVRFSLHLNGTGDDQLATPDGPPFKMPGAVGDARTELSLSATADRSIFVFNGSSFDTPPEIYAAKPGGTTRAGPYGLIRLSHINDGIQPAWGKTVSLDWTSDAFHVQGWLMYPKDYDPAKKYPMIVEVHGGPASAVLGRWGGGAGGFGTVEFSALGYFVLMPNPRGSYGQGEAFTQANRKDFGYGDLRDILAGVDTVLAKYPVDPNRIGIAGWSYGGFMTMFAVTQTSRFKAAVAGAGISDWLSYYGENSIDQWMIPYFGASVYDDPQVYAKSSAMTFIKQAHTPTLAVVGDRDGECPAPQSFEFWHALHDLHVPAQLVVYPNEGHGFVDPEHRRDVMERAADWFDRYLPATP
jgi:dipeptidyl aminopeptidase/acylaminoacyl peptidase